MEIGNDLIASLRSRLGHSVSDDSDARPDWSALQARYAAAHAMRRELLAGLADRGAAGGSFGRFAALSQQAGGIAQRGVNRTDLVNGKHRGGKDLVTDGATMTAGRGR